MRFAAGMICAAACNQIAVVLLFFIPSCRARRSFLLRLRWSMRWRRGLGRDSTPASPRVIRNALKPPFFIPSAIVSQVCAAYRGAIF